MKIQLSFAMAPNPRSLPVLDGRVKADGIDMIPTPLHPSEIFWRQLRFADFDVSEMSFSSLIMAMSKGDDRWIGLPIFTTREFFHTRILVRRDAGIESPADLKGKRVGVPEWGMTAVIYIRGWVMHQLGIPLQKIEWFQGGLNEPGRTEKIVPVLPPGTKLTPVADRSLSEMLLAGDIDAIFAASPPGFRVLANSFMEAEYAMASEFVARFLSWPPGLCSTNTGPTSLKARKMRPGRL